MQQAVAPPSKSYSEVLGAINSKVSPKWDDGQCPFLRRVSAARVGGPAAASKDYLSRVRAHTAPGASTIYNSMETLKEEGYLTRWNSATLKSRPVAQGELKRQLKTDKNLDEVCSPTWTCMQPLPRKQPSAARRGRAGV